MGRTTVVNWLSRTLKEEKERKRDKAFALWLSCHTQEEIAEQVEVPQQTIVDWIKDFTEKSKDDISVFSSDFDIPIYNVWKQQSKSNKVDHFGNSELRWRENRRQSDTAPAVIIFPLSGGNPREPLPACTPRWKIQDYPHNHESNNHGKALMLAIFKRKIGYRK